jgi:hypothetical protein
LELTSRPPQLAGAPLPSVPLQPAVVVSANKLPREAHKKTCLNRRSNDFMLVTFWLYVTKEVNICASPELNG